MTAKTIWTPLDDDRIRNMVDAGHHPDDIAKALGRGPYTTRRHIELMRAEGLITSKPLDRRKDRTRYGNRPSRAKPPTVMNDNETPEARGSRLLHEATERYYNTRASKLRKRS